MSLRHSWKHAAKVYREQYEELCDLYRTARLDNARMFGHLELNHRVIQDLKHALESSRT